ncbi:hypothetical protein AZH47_07700 [Corynebacterium striatum]|nr:hypothetical protein AZH47_07700 [Corynebacterium striatum]
MGSDSWLGRPGHARGAPSTFGPRGGAGDLKGKYPSENLLERGEYREKRVNRKNASCFVISRLFQSLKSVKGKDISDMNRIDGWLSELGTALRESRKAYQLTQEELGELVGVSDRTVRDVELGTGKASFSTVLELLSAVGLRVEVVNA